MRQLVGSGSIKPGTQDRESRNRSASPEPHFLALEEREANYNEPAVLRSGRFPLWGRSLRKWEKRLEGREDTAESPGTFPTAEREGKISLCA